MMGNGVQCEVQQSVWCESQYDVRATSDGEWIEDHETGFVTEHNETINQWTLSL